MGKRKERYELFLRSPEWRKLRAKVLERDGHKCTRRGCHATEKLHVHHKRYRWKPSEWGTEPLEWLTTLCEEHHKAEHEKIRERKAARKRWRQQRRRLRKQTGM